MNFKPCEREINNSYINEKLSQIMEMRLICMFMRRIPQNKRDYYRNVYLRSEHWKNLRKEKKKLNPVCEVCGSKKKLDVHHINYRMLYDVLLEDLQTLC